LIVVVSDTESALEPFMMTVCAEELSAKRVDRTALHELGGRAQVIQARAYLLGGLVGEREGVDPAG
jgi:hypothetical protein